MWKTTHIVNRNAPPDAGQDADGDLQTNVEEDHAGTDPRDPTSSFRITVAAVEGQDVRVEGYAGEAKTPTP